MKRMLINATHAEELRVALIDGQRLYDLDIEIPSKRQYKSNIYKGKVTKVEASLEAAFIDYGMPRQGFLPLKEIAPQYFSSPVEGNARPKIADILKEGQEILVQVEKEERGNKGAALTSFISLPGRFLVLMPQNPSAGGISRRVEGDDRKNLREQLNTLDIPENTGIIARTAAIGKTAEELGWDLEYLYKLWTAIDVAWHSKPAPFLVYQDNDVIIRTLRDYLSPDIGEILTDDTVTFNNTMAFIQQVMPNHASKLKHYQDSTPLFTRFHVEGQIEKAFHREVRLRSGGSIVIDPTEALVSIDVNSARATKGGDIEETALNTNLEAVDEVARQLRLRDLGGLVVIDFIDMSPARNIKAVETKLREAVKQDRARIQVGRISRFGLMEMSRQRLRPALADQHQATCHKCHGQGVIRSVDSISISILRQLEEEFIKQSAEKMIVQLPVDVATFILNEKRSTLSVLEARYKTHLIIIPNKTLSIPEFHFKKLNPQDKIKSDVASYEHHETYNKKSLNLDKMTSATPQSADTPMVKGVAPSEIPVSSTTSPTPKEDKKEESGGIIKRLFGSFFTADQSKESSEKEIATAQKKEPHSAAKQETKSRKGNHDEQGKHANSNRRRQQNRNRNTARKNRDSAAVTSSESENETKALNKQPNKPKNTTQEKPSQRPVKKDSDSESKTQQRPRRRPQLPTNTRKNRDEFKYKKVAQTLIENETTTTPVETAPKPLVESIDS